MKISTKQLRHFDSGALAGEGYPYYSSAYWNDPDHLVIRWTMKYSESFTVYVSVDTSAGHRYLYYTPVNSDGLGTGTYVHHGLGSDARDGQWRTFERDLLADLREAQPTVDIIDVNAFLIRGSGYIDTIMLLSRQEVGELQVPSGQSHFRFADIESRPSYPHWHGPLYVHGLDRPFRLYQLSEFSVHGYLEQVSDPSYMGQARVALYDDNMKLIMAVRWYDDWSYVAHTYFLTEYYNLDGTSGELLTDSGGILERTGTLWYDPATNTVKSSIPGYTPATLAEVDDPGRVVKYVVVQGLRFGGNPMQELGVHDIRVVADLTRSNPTAPAPGEPEVYDGTAGPIDATPDPDPDVLSFRDHLLSLAAHVVYWWKGWWPRLHAFYSACPSPTSSLTLHISVDILGAVMIEQLTFHTTLEDDLTAQQKSAPESSIDDKIWDARGGWFAFVGRLLGYSLMAIDALGAFFLVPGTITAFNAAVVAWSIMFGVWILWMLEYVNLGLLSAILAAALIANFMESYFVQLVILGVAWAGAALLGKTSKALPSLLANNGLRGLWMVLLIALKIAVIVVCSHMYAYFYEKALIEIGVGGT